MGGTRVPHRVRPGRAADTGAAARILVSPARPAPDLARLLVAAVLLLGVVTGTGWLVSHAGPDSATGRADAAIARWLTAHRTPTLDALSDPTDELGGIGLVIGVALVGSVLVLAVLRRGARRSPSSSR